jgi:prepilin-type N-terminal cleavage/methylation domain-containing protein
MKGTHGFTLIEVLVIMVIVGILATGVVFMFANPNAKVKTQAFNLLGEMNMARSEAVTRNQEVLVDFVFGAQDGYQICVDATGGVPPIIGDDDCSDETGENFIQETLFPQGVKYYNPSVTPVDGPAATPGGGDLIGAASDGIVLDNDTKIDSITMDPDGTLEDTITEDASVVIFLPEGGDLDVIRGTPYAVTIKPNGGASIGRWIMGDTWFRK